MPLIRTTILTIPQANFLPLVREDIGFSQSDKRNSAKPAGPEYTETEDTATFGKR
jgi:hypothetical protein